MRRVDADVDNLVFKFAREMVPIFLIILMVAVSLEGFFVKANADSVRALESQNAILQQSQAQSDRQFEIFLKNFTAEANYSCMIAELRAQMDHFPLPRSGTCTVVAP